MKRTKPQLRHAAVAALATAACYASLPAVAAAPGPNADELQEIVVTGSILRRTDAETPSPVSVVTAEDLELRGINTVAEGLQRLSANGAGAMTQGWNTGSNFANGANAVSLRGLTVQSTLTIFDGLRMAPYPLADDGHRNFVDLNTIPDAVLDRIEVLRDGASSTYGADAIAGVVNVITKKEFSGLRLNASGLGTIKGGTERVVYATAKTGIVGFTRAQAFEWAKTGIRMNCIAPGLFPDFSSPESAGERMSPEQYDRAVPMGRPGKFREVGLLALYLASPASDYMTGQTIHINGGLSNSGV